ncbi:MAG: 4-hydroxythreonine-4-phosphate dehydrogenase PdxA [Magnetococcales bacterium]|nr:4-hydroxythreonine-4-phosphate dehydrogenase PdxA [Magnetococcales bacterium]
MKGLPLAVTMGDPVGVGPEIVLKAFVDSRQRADASCRLLHVGDPEVYARTARHLGLEVAFRVFERWSEDLGTNPACFDILATQARAEPGVFQFGKPHPGHAAAVVESIETACRLAQTGQVAAMVTPPIHKGSIHAAGFDFPGHTELLARLTGVDCPVMMLAGSGLRVVPATIHQSLASVPATLSREGLHQIIRLTLEALRVDFAIPEPRVVVAGLNPHAGEDGAFGEEELTLIGPVCRALAEEFPFLRGPLPADTLFHPKARAGYDAVIGMYHDQVLIPLKMLAFGNAINVTLNLPIVRTSVDHGTAHNIAGQGIADTGSYWAALTAAEEIALNRAAWGLRMEHGQ